MKTTERARAYGKSGQRGLPLAPPPPSVSHLGGLALGHFLRRELHQIRFELHLQGRITVGELLGEPAVGNEDGSIIM